MEVAEKGSGMSTASKRALTAFEKSFTSEFGAGTLESAIDGPEGHSVIPTGSLTLDYAFGVGGYVEGRLGEIYGVDDVGKTALGILGGIEAQHKYPDQPIAWIDMERKFEKPWAAEFGLDLSMTRLFHPTNAEDVADAMKRFLESGLFSMVILDSVGAMIPEEEKKKQAGEVVVAKLPGVVTRMVKLANVSAEKTKVPVILINQVRANLSPYGKDTRTGGGWALKYATSWKLEVKRTGATRPTVSYGDDKVPVGQEISIKVERNKFAPAGRNAKVMLITTASPQFGPIGFDRADEAATLGVNLGIIAHQGNTYIVPSGEKAVGRDKLLAHLRANPDQVADIRTQVLATRADEVHPETELPGTELPDLEAQA